MQYVQAARCIVCSRLVLQRGPGELAQYSVLRYKLSLDNEPYAKAAIVTVLFWQKQRILTNIVSKNANAQVTHIGIA